MLSRFDVEIAAGSTVQVKKLLAPSEACDLVIFEARGAAASNMGEIGSLAEDRACPLIVIVDEADVGELRLPAVPSDFVVHGASQAECSVRVLLK